jgi:hypothetical protein
MPLPLLPEQARLETAIESQLIRSLGAVDFADELPENPTPEQLDKLTVPLIRFILQTGEKGYKDGVDEITDKDGNPPSAENNWLTTDRGIEGLFIDRRPDGDRTFTFILENDGDNWGKSFQRLAEEV